MEVKEQLEKIQETKPDTEVRICRRIEIGNTLHQGDIYLHRVAEDHQKGKILGTRKLAIGQGEGSNHIAEGNLEVYEGKKLPGWVDFGNSRFNQQALGPVVVAKTEWSNTHPRHAHHRCPAGTYQVTYQLDMQTQQRVRD